MKRNIISSVVTVFAWIMATHAQNIQLDKVFTDAEQQTKTMLNEIQKANF